MRRRTELLLGISCTVAATCVVAWGMVQILVVRPTLATLESTRVEQVLRAADEIEAGGQLKEVEERMQVDLRYAPGPPEGPPQLNEGRWSRSWVAVPTEGRTVWKRDGGEYEIAAWGGREWVVLHKDELPVAWLSLVVLLLAGVPVVLVMDRIGANASSPVAMAEASLERIAGGDLEHRLDETMGTTELQRLAVAVNSMAGRIQALVHAERRRMAGLSHELRTPLTRIRLELELARRAGVDPYRLDRIERDVAAFDQMLGELLELSRLEIGGDRALRREQVDLRGLAELLVEEEGFRGVDVDGQGEAWVDPALVRRVLSNLLRNSARHAPGSNRWIVVRDNGLEVGDDGPGIPRQDHPRLFEVFWRGPSGDRSGHGVGLSVVEQIVFLHGARCTLSDPPGLVVTLDFPPPPSPQAMS